MEGDGVNNHHLEVIVLSSDEEEEVNGVVTDPQEGPIWAGPYKWPIRCKTLAAAYVPVNNIHAVEEDGVWRTGQGMMMEQPEVNDDPAYDPAGPLIVMEEEVMEGGVFEEEVMEEEFENELQEVVNGEDQLVQPGVNGGAEGSSVVKIELQEVENTEDPRRGTEIEEGQLGDWGGGQATVKREGMQQVQRAEFLEEFSEEVIQGAAEEVGPEAVEEAAEEAVEEAVEGVAPQYGFRCMVCPRMFKKRSSFKPHLVSHFYDEFEALLPRGKLNACPKCDYIARVRIGLYRHFCWTHNMLLEVTGISLAAVKPQQLP